MAKNTDRVLLLFACILLLLPLLSLVGVATEEPPLITDFNELMAAVHTAEDGDVLLVGDIDFSPLSPDVPNSTMSITIDKSITIKSGKAQGTATFLNGGFLLSGSKVTGEILTVSFENIIFDGKANFDSLTEQDFAYPWSEVDQAPSYYAPLKAQQALSFKGNVDASFTGCSFQNYMHEYGPVIDIRYGDYTGNEFYQGFDDFSGCRLNLDFDNCRILRNTAFYDGGAIYIEGNQNVTLRAQNTVFFENRSTNGNYRRGGGAIWASGAALMFTDCTLEQNIANYVFPDTVLPEIDSLKGGAVLLEDGSLTMTNCTLRENCASVGGAISLTNGKAELDGCRLTGNQAQHWATNPYNSVGPKSNMGQGGALYVEGNRNDTTLLINCEIKNNTASMAYGGIYGYYVDFEDPSLPAYLLKAVLCSFEGNTSHMDYDYKADNVHLWWSHPGDLYANPHVSMFGCYVIDESYANDLPRHDTPSEENDYNYLSATADSIMLGYPIPAAAAEKFIADRYEGKLASIHVGSNYKESLYKEEPPTPPDITPPSTTGPSGTESAPTAPSKDTSAQAPAWGWIAGIACFVLLAAGICLYWYRRKMSVPAAAPQPVAEAPRVVLSRYDDAQIARILANIPEAQLLTPRETEVLQEMLKGKKQGEVAYYLGIEVSTVKDFYRKIYGKLNVANKDGIFTLADEALRK